MVANRPGGFAPLLHRRGRLLSSTAEIIATGMRLTPPYESNHGQLENENEESGFDHRASGRGHVFRLDVNRVPQREASPVAPLSGEAIPDREGDRHELSR